MSSSQPYGVLLVTGMRTHQEGYAMDFAHEPRCRLVAVTDEADVPAYRAELNRKFAHEMDIPYIPDLDEALSRDDVDIVSICAEHERRGRVAVKCAQSGKHLYLDKPITCSIADADAVAAAVEKAGVLSQMFSYTHVPWAEPAKQAVDSGSLGEVVNIHCEVMFAKGYAGTAPLGKPRKQEPYPEKFTFVDSKRELRTTGVYAVALIRWISGMDVREVFCITGNYFFAEHYKNNVEDFGVMALTLEDDSIATVACGRIGYMSHPKDGPHRMIIIGTEGTLTVDAYKPRIEVYADEPAWTPPPVNPGDPMGFWSSTRKAVGAKPKRGWVTLHRGGKPVTDVTHFIDCLESGRESEMSAKDAAAVVEVLMAGYVSAASGEPVSLPLPR